MRILVVEDDDSVRQLTAAVLDKYGYRVTAVSSPSAAMAQVSQCNEAFDLLLSDVVMPGMNGFQATRKLNQDPKTSSIPVIIITTKDQETDKIWGMRQGAVEYLVKPIRENDLVAKINAVMAD